MSDVNRVVFMNVGIMTAEGTYRYEQVTLDEAQGVAGMEVEKLSAVGHEATAQVMTELLKVPVQVNRISYAAQEGDKMLILKMRGRIPEGTILSREEMEKIGFDFYTATYQE